MAPHGGLCTLLTISPRHLPSAAWLMLSHPYLVLGTVPGSYLAPSQPSCGSLSLEMNQTRHRENIPVSNGDAGVGTHLCPLGGLSSSLMGLWC